MDTDALDIEYGDIEVALPPELLAELDRYVAEHGYENRSAAVRAALRKSGP